MRLTKAAQALQNAESKVLDVALHSGFDSHDGFTRAFYRRFAVTPHQYQNELPAVNWFVPHPIEAYYTLKEGKTTMDKEKVSRTVTVSVVQRPAKKADFFALPSGGLFFSLRRSGL